MSWQVTCPHCKQTGEITHTFTGEDLTCPNCGKRLAPRGSSRTRHPDGTATFGPNKLLFLGLPILFLGVIPLCAYGIVPLAWERADARLVGRDHIGDTFNRGRQIPVYRTIYSFTHANGEQLVVFERDSARTAAPTFTLYYDPQQPHHWCNGPTPWLMNFFGLLGVVVGSAFVYFGWGKYA